MKDQALEEYFQLLKQIHDIDSLPEEPVDFKRWCLWKHKEMQLKTDTTEIKDNPHPEIIATRLREYPGEFSWAISQRYLVEKELGDMQREYDRWYRKKFMHLSRQPENVKATNKTIEMLIQENYEVEYEKFQIELEDLRLKKESLIDHISVWKKLDNVYSSLMNDSNAEFWRTYKKYDRKPDGQH